MKYTTEREVSGITKEGKLPLGQGLASIFGQVVKAVLGREQGIVVSGLNLNSANHDIIDFDLKVIAQNLLFLCKLAGSVTTTAGVLARGGRVSTREAWAVLQAPHDFGGELLNNYITAQ